MYRDFASVLAALAHPLRILVLGDDARDRDFALALATLRHQPVELGVSHGSAAATVALPRAQTEGPEAAVKVSILPRPHFHETDRAGSHDLLVMRGLEQCTDPLDALVHARMLDVKLLCLVAGMVPSSLCTVDGRLPESGTTRLAARNLAPATRHALAERIDRAFWPHGAIGIVARATEWQWFMTAAGLRDLLARAGWHVFREAGHACGRHGLFVCAREPNGQAGTAAGRRSEEAGA